jgi:hypothetical protein
MFFLKGPQKDRKYNDYWKNNTNIWYRNRFRHPKTTWNSCISSLPIGAYMTLLECWVSCLPTRSLSNFVQGHRNKKLFNWPLSTHWFIRNTDADKIPQVQLGLFLIIWPDTEIDIEGRLRTKLYNTRDDLEYWAKEKVQKDKQRSKKHTHKTKDRVTQTLLKTGAELGCSWRVSSSCSTSDAHTNTIIIKFCPEAKK